MLQIHIPEELEKLKNMQILGLIGMATNTSDTDQVWKGFRGLKKLFEYIKSNFSNTPNLHFAELSMETSNDFPIAL